jgi:hypothetical protein
MRPSTATHRTEVTIATRPLTIFPKTRKASDSETAAARTAQRSTTTAPSRLRFGSVRNLQLLHRAVEIDPNNANVFRNRAFSCVRRTPSPPPDVGKRSASTGRRTSSRHSRPSPVSTVSDQTPHSTRSTLALFEGEFLGRSALSRFFARHGITVNKACAPQSESEPTASPCTMVRSRCEWQRLFNTNQSIVGDDRADATATDRQHDRREASAVRGCNDTLHRHDGNLVFAERHHELRAELQMRVDELRRGER